MIDDYWTFVFFGYTSETLSYGSGKRVVVMCDNCASYRSVQFRSYRDLCGSCSQKEKILSIEHKTKIGDANRGSKRSVKTKHNMSIAQEGHYTSEATKLKISNSLTGRSLTDEHKKNVGIGGMGRVVSDKTKLLMSIRRKKYLRDHPDVIDKMRENAINQIHATKNTSIELKMQEILRKNEYSFVIHIPCCKICVPDILFPEKKIAIFCDGDYWHSLSDRVERDNKQNIVLLENGWTPIRLWEHDINNDIEKCFRMFEDCYIGK